MRNWKLVKISSVLLAGLLLSIAILYQLPSEDEEGDKRRYYGEVWGDLTVNGTISSSWQMASREFTIVSYGRNNNYTELELEVDKLTQAIVVDKSVGHEKDRTVALGNGSLKIWTKNGYIKSKLLDVDISADYMTYEGTWEHSGGFYIRSRFNSISGQANIAHDPQKEYDLEIFHCMVQMENETIEVRKGGIVVPPDEVGNLSVSFRGWGKVLPYPDVTVNGSLSVTDFRELSPSHVLLDKHQHIAVESNNITIRTVRPPHIDYGRDDHLDPWIVEITTS